MRGLGVVVALVGGVAMAGGELMSTAISEGWHIEDLITKDDCPRRAQPSDHLLLRYTVKDAYTGAHVYATPDTEVYHLTLPDTTTNTTTTTTTQDEEQQYLVKEEVAPGFVWGVEGMCEGGVRRITVPPSVGYISPSMGPPMSGIEGVDLSTVVLDFYVTLLNITSSEDYAIFRGFEKGNYSEVLDMIEERKGINAVDQWGATPLMLAVSSEAQVVVAGLLNSWAPRVDVNARKPTGYNAVFYAASKKNSSILKALLRRGADPNISIQSGESKGYTPLHIAVKLEHYRNAALLIEFGADPLVSAADGTRPLDLIKEFTKSSKAKFFNLLTEAATRSHKGEL